MNNQIGEVDFYEWLADAKAEQTQDTEWDSDYYTVRFRLKQTK